jgi:beta-lactam-binding protein with PASTA domain
LKLEALGVKTDFQGSGRVTEQLPPEGTPYDSDTTVRLILSENDAPSTLGVSGKRYE